MPLYVGVQLHRTSSASARHGTATECFDQLKEQLKDVEDDDLHRYIEWWRQWVRLMDPDSSAAQRARSDLAAAMEDGPQGVSLAPVAWAFEITFNAGPLTAWLAKRREIGGLNREERFAECVLNHGAMPPDEFLRYVTEHRAQLRATIPPAMLAILECEAYLKGERVEEARSCAERAREHLAQGEYQRLLAGIEAVSGEDPGARLEAVYREDQSLQNLKALVTHVRASGQCDRLPALERDLFGRERTLENARRVVQADETNPGAAPGVSLDFLDAIPDLVAQDDDLKAFRARALFHHGRFAEARILNDTLVARRKWQNTELAIYLALYLAEWERIATLVEQEWQHRPEHPPEVLLQLGQLAAESETGWHRALDFARLAVQRSDGDPKILTGAYMLHVRLGREDQVETSWLPDAAAASSEEGPVREVSLDALVRDFLPRRSAFVDEVSGLVAAGRIPISVAAGEFQVPLISVFLHTAKQNEAARDGRQRGILPIAPGGRKPVRISRDWTVALDLTSVFVLHTLGLLEAALDALGNTVLSPDVFAVLFSERHMARFHQPSQIRNARELRLESDAGRVCTVPEGAILDGDLTAEVGARIAALLTEARAQGGFVVCDRPVYRFDSLMTREAALGDWAGSLLSPLELCEVLWRSSQLSGAQITLARTLLPDVPWRDQPPDRLGGPVYLTGAALHRLQDARLFGSIASGDTSVYVHSRTLDGARTTLETGSVAEELVAAANEIRATLRKAIEDGKASLMPREHRDREPEDDDLRAWDSTQSLMAGAAGCDAACIDDRFLGAQGGVQDRTGRVVPIVSVLDILREMRRREAIGVVRYMEALHKLRSSGAIIVPVDAEELVFRSRANGPTVDADNESAEMRTIRQMAAHADVTATITQAELFPIVEASLRATVGAIRDLWTDPDVPTARAAHLASRLWRQLEATPLGTRETVVSDVAGRSRASMSMALGLLLSPIVTLDDERRGSYRSWLESVLAPLRVANGHVIDEAARKVLEAIGRTEGHAQILGHFYLTQLPQETRRVVIEACPEFARASGYETRSVLTVDGGAQVEAATLLRASREALRTGASVAVHDVEGQALEIGPLAGAAGVEIRGKRGEGEVGGRLPDLAMVASTASARRQAVRRLVERVGPTWAVGAAMLKRGPGYAIPDEEVALALRESSGGFARRRQQCMEAVQSGKLSVDDLVPPSVSYFDALAVPPSEEMRSMDYVRQTLVPYRKTLLRRQLGKGLELALSGALHDDLCPGRWLTRHGDDRVWGAVRRVRNTRNPFALLGLLDVALYRSGDARFEELATCALRRLADPRLEAPDGVDRYEVLASVSALASDNLAVLPECATRPNYWRRTCALMQGGWLLDVLEPTGVRSDWEEFQEWIESQRHVAGLYAEAIGARREHMLHAGMLKGGTLRDEVLGRLELLRVRHERAGRRTSWSEETDRAWQRVREGVRTQLLGFPGPLEGDRRPRRKMPEDIVEALHAACEDRPDISRLRILAMLSQGGRPGARDLAAARAAVTRIAESDIGLPEITELNFASIVALACRNRALGDEVAAALIRVSGGARDVEIVHQILRLVVQTAAVHAEKEPWSRWLAERLEGVARALPGPPSGALDAFLEGLRTIEVVLPVEEWCHLRARAVAHAGAA
ncbi:MAG: hypothetical protein F4Y20_03625 [Acidobacteria bacterium]|nr:hypothetical protein [Acidobacteriota bacterium]